MTAIDLSILGSVVESLQPLLTWVLPITLSAVFLIFIRSFFK